MTGSGVGVHAWMVASRVNGPGYRSVVWFQGCTLACPGCFNPATRAATGGLVSVADLITTLLEREPDAEGLTVSGGEPLEQPTALAELITEWKKRSGTGVVVLTGFTWREVQRDAARRGAVVDADVVIAGRYTAALHVGSGLRGSANKTYHFLTDRYTIEDLVDVPEAEVVISPDGVVQVTGVAGSEALKPILGYAPAGRGEEFIPNSVN